MICRDLLHGEKLKVGDLNEITVLIDRSETKMTEVAMNYWQKGLDGPPHSHGAKEQIFYITEGEGKVTVGNESYPVKPGSLIYIPKGVVHQSVTSSDALTYLLFNAFLDPDKEGHATFADHISHVSSIRQRQADTGNAATDPDLSRNISAKRPRAITDARGTTSAILVAHADTEACEVERVDLERGATHAKQYNDREQTIFVLTGIGTLNVGDEQCDIKPGVVAFVPVNALQTVRAGKSGLAYLSLGTFIVK